jgi:hypothetical protein
MDALFRSQQNLEVIAISYLLATGCIAILLPLSAEDIAPFISVLTDKRGDIKWAI